VRSDRSHCQGELNWWKSFERKKWQRKRREEKKGKEKSVVLPPLPATDRDRTD